MKKIERYVVERVSIGFWFPETFCELKDTESEFYVRLKNMDAAIKIKDLLNQQDKRIKDLKHENQRLHTELSQKVDYIHEIVEVKEQLKQSQNQLAISALEEVNSILTNIIIEVTEYEMNLDKLCYLEEISYEFGQAIKNKVEGLKK